MFRRWFLYICGTELSQWGAHKRKNAVVICDETGGFFYDNQTQKEKQSPSQQVNEAAIIKNLSLVSVIGNAILSANYETLASLSTIALVAAIISIVGKETMYWYTRYYAKLINSSAFLADAWHHRSDAFSSIGSLIGIGGAIQGFPAMDSVASVIICIFIVKVAYDISKDALVKMLDTSCSEEFEKEITDISWRKRMCLA